MKYKITKWFDRYHIWKKHWYGWKREKDMGCVIEFDTIEQAEVYCKKASMKNMGMSQVVKEVELL